MTMGILFALGCAIVALIYGAVSVQWILAKPAGSARSPAPSRRARRPT
jgi:K(+)-stimulated pyrophosphate-energized sodium pump